MFLKVALNSITLAPTPDNKYTFTNCLTSTLYPLTSNGGSGCFSGQLSVFI